MRHGTALGSWGIEQRLLMCEAGQAMRGVTAQTPAAGAATAPPLVPRVCGCSQSTVRVSEGRICRRFIPRLHPQVFESDSFAAACAANLNCLPDRREQGSSARGRGKQFRDSPHPHAAQKQTPAPQLVRHWDSSGRRSNRHSGRRFSPRTRRRRV